MILWAFLSPIVFKFISLCCDGKPLWTANDMHDNARNLKLGPRRLVKQARFLGFSTSVAFCLSPLLPWVSCVHKKELPSPSLVTSPTSPLSSESTFQPLTSWTSVFLSEAFQDKDLFFTGWPKWFDHSGKQTKTLVFYPLLGIRAQAFLRHFSGFLKKNHPLAEDSRGWLRPKLCLILTFL